MKGLASIREANPASLAEQVSEWAAVERAKAEAGLHVTSFSLSTDHEGSVERAVGLMLPRLGTAEEPNRRGIALDALCAEWAGGCGYSAEPTRRGGRCKAVSPQPTQLRGRQAPAAVSQEPTQEVESDG